MFTGIVEALGRVHAGTPVAGGGARLWIASDLAAGLADGESIAVNGCCLTVVARAPGRFAVDAVPETLARTTIGTWREGEVVNLERAMRLDQRLGGHLVQGHVDGVGEVLAVAAEGDGRRVTIDVPPDLAAFVAHKGSLAVDGTSLTVAGVTGTRCEIALIPYTLTMTVAGGYAPGRRVHLEVDLVARYLARLLEARESGSVA